MQSNQAWFERSLPWVMRLLWGAALFTLPVTSFRYFPGMGDSTLVRPLAFYPAALLMVLIGLQVWRGGQASLPRTGVWVPLVAFLACLVAASFFGAVLDPLPLRGQEYWGRVLRAWVTVGIGLSFFMAAVWMNRTEADVRFTVRWLLAGLVMNMVWSGVQALAFYTPLLDKVTVTYWQRAFSMRELVRTNRVSGMAFEPAWLAGQLATVYLPWLIAALLTRVRVTRFKAYELLLLGGACLLLLATYSRGGLVTALMAVALTVLVAGRAELRSAWQWFMARSWALRAGVTVLAAGVLVGAGVFLSQKDYFSRLFTTEADSLEEFIIENSAGARAAYTFGALGAYEDSPWLGVGLGASGFYIYDHLPDWAMTTVPEIAKQFSPENRLYPNPKNMYARLLAESGIFGFFLFLAFQLALLAEALVALQRREVFARFLGVAGLCAWLAIVMYNATQDSFATPNLWINLGVLAGVMAGWGQRPEAGEQGSAESEAGLTSLSN